MQMCQCVCVCVNNLTHHEADIWIGSVWCVCRLFVNGEGVCKYASDYESLCRRIGSLYIHVSVSVCVFIGLWCREGWTD